ncbi:sensor histidine kinase [Caulobacter sp. LARHSG274]
MNGHPSLESPADETARLRDEMEQLRTALEGAVEDNIRLVEDRDRLRGRVTMLARELQAANAAYAAAAAPDDAHPPEVLARSEALSQSEEELRVAFEELQVLTEELEATNATLHSANRDLDAKVAERTREIASANAALRVSETSFRAIADVVPDLLWRADNVGQVTWCNSRWYDYTGQDLQAALGAGWIDALHPDDRDPTREAWTAAVNSGETFQRQYRVRHRSGDYRWFLARAEPLHDGRGRVSQWFGAVTDVHELIQLQDRQAVLVAELQHRTRNLMAVVETVIRKTLASSKDVAEARGRIEERFGSLARVQGLLSRRPTGGRVSFDALLSDELAAHVPLADDQATSQVSLEGPTGVELRSTHVQTLALALHELTTNAVKYGALAHPGGRLTVGWAVREVSADERRLVVDWRETGVPGMPPPNPDAARGGGYGRQLIERALPYQLGATTAFGFADDGVHCTIELPLPTPDRTGGSPHV